MFLSTQAVVLSLITLSFASRSNQLQVFHQLQARNILLGRQVTTHPCAPVSPPATCASSCGPAYITCPGGSVNDCYNPTTEVCCGDGTSCPAGTTCGSKLNCIEGTGTTSNAGGQATTQVTTIPTTPPVTTKATSTPVVGASLTSSSPSSSSNSASQLESCASTFGAGFITCSGGNGIYCYNPATEICCGDGTNCPIGTTCGSLHDCVQGTTTQTRSSYTVGTTATNPATPTSQGTLASIGNRESHCEGICKLRYFIAIISVLVSLVML